MSRLILFIHQAEDITEADTITKDGVDTITKDKTVDGLFRGYALKNERFKISFWLYSTFEKTPGGLPNLVHYVAVKMGSWNWIPFH